MIPPVYDVGDPIRSRCTKCKVVTRHLVVALVAGKPVRVQCTRCEGIHNYRPATAEKPEKPSTAGRSTVRRGKKGSAVEEEWQRLTTESTRVPVGYHMAVEVNSGDLLEHPKFGLGVVRKTVPPNTVEVLFRDGIKRLRCGGPPATGSG